MQIRTGHPNRIELSRGPSGVKTNVPHTVIRHSPTGFEWGYGGSGPADLALNILLLFVEQPVADRLYQQFKWDFIASMSYEGGTISSSEIINWIEKQDDPLKMAARH
jgi:hypothetical protein